MDTSEGTLDGLQVQVIRDKTLSRHDALFKLILIGDTCKWMLTVRWSCKHILPSTNNCLIALFHQTAKHAQVFSFLLRNSESSRKEGEYFEMTYSFVKFKITLF